MARIDDGELALLQRRLTTPTSPGLLGAPDLAAIRAQGRRRRYGRRALAVVGGALATAAVLGSVFAVGSLTGPGPSGSLGGDRVAGGEEEVPRELSPLAERVLRDVPGAVQVSRWQVVIPVDGAVREYDERVDPGDVVGAAVPLGAGAYTGVTAFPEGTFPAWLYDGVQRIEQEELGESDGSHPVGSTEMGILVDWADAELGCVAGRSDDGESLPAGACDPAVLARGGSAAYLQWTMGTEDFLEPGAGMELFTSENYRSGARSTVWIGGVDGTAVARVDYVLDDGTVVDGEVLAGTLVPDETLFVADVEGDLAKVVAYDRDGRVLEDHEVEACSGGVDCEVR